MFASSYEDIATGIDDFLSSNTKVADANTMCSTYRLSFAQRINKAPKVSVRMESSLHITNVISISGPIIAFI